MYAKSILSTTGLNRKPTMSTSRPDVHALWTWNNTTPTAPLSRTGLTCFFLSFKSLLNQTLPCKPNAALETWEINPEIREPHPLPYPTARHRTYRSTPQTDARLQHRRYPIWNAWHQLCEVSQALDTKPTRTSSYPPEAKGQPTRGNLEVPDLPDLGNIS